MKRKRLPLKVKRKHCHQNVRLVVRAFPLVVRTLSLSLEPPSFWAWRAGRARPRTWPRMRPWLALHGQNQSRESSHKPRRHSIASDAHMVSMASRAVVEPWLNVADHGRPRPSIEPRPWPWFRPKPKPRDKKATQRLPKASRRSTRGRRKDDQKLNTCDTPLDYLPHHKNLANLTKILSKIVTNIGSKT